MKNNLNIKINIKLYEPGFNQEDYDHMSLTMLNKIIDIASGYGIGSISYSLE